MDEICTRVVDTFYSASDFSKKAFCDFRNWWRENHKDDEVKVKESKKEPENKTETLKVNNNSVITVDNNEVDTKKNKVNNTDVEKPKPVFSSVMLSILRENLLAIFLVLDILIDIVIIIGHQLSFLLMTRHLRMKKLA